MDYYQVEYLTLRRLSAIAISKHLWMNGLKDDLRSCIDRGVEPWKVMPSPMKMVLDVLDNILVPEAAKVELKFAVADMGWELWSHRGLFHRYRCPDIDEELLKIKNSAYLDYVCWTAFGRVDLAATLRSLYFAEMLHTDFNSWSQLCDYNVEDRLNDLWPKLLNKYETKTTRGIPIHCSNSTPCAYWIVRFQIQCGI